MPLTNEEMAIRSSGSSITNRTKLYVTLRWLAGGSYLDLCFAWGLSLSSFYDTVLWPTINAVDKALDIGMPLKDEGKLQTIANEFSKLSKGQLKGCVIAIDKIMLVRYYLSFVFFDYYSYRDIHDMLNM